MRIKKYKNNQYVLADGVWVRNMCSDAEAVDVNLLGKSDLDLFLHNEVENIRASSLHMDVASQVSLENLVVFSDGYEWARRQLVLSEMSNKVVKTIGVNGSLSKWSMVGDSDKKRTMTFYLVNNPYRECLGYLPKRHSYYPNLIASTKTNPDFLKAYKSQPYFYMATKDTNYSGIGHNGCMFLDDYRNPICAAISLAWRCGVKKMALLCCDDAFADERPNAVRMENGLYQYPQQIMCQKIIDKQIYWMRRAGVEIVDCSSGIKYENADYIDFDGLPSFFKKDQNG
jgi:hypothetical protein